MAKNFVPLYDKVLVKRLDSEGKTMGGVLIPDNAKEKPVKGEVIALGQGKMDDKGVLMPFAVKVGDTVLFNKWAGTEVKIDDEDYVVMKESDIVGIYIA